MVNCKFPQNSPPPSLPYIFEISVEFACRREAPLFKDFLMEPLTKFTILWRYPYPQTKKMWISRCEKYLSQEWYFVDPNQYTDFPAKQIRMINME